MFLPDLGLSASLSSGGHRSHRTCPFHRKEPRTACEGCHPGDTAPEDALCPTARHTRVPPSRVLSRHACVLKIRVITGDTLITEYSGFPHRRNLSSNLLLNFAFLNCIKNICLALRWTLSQRIIFFKAQGNHFPVILQIKKKKNHHLRRVNTPNDTLPVPGSVSDSLYSVDQHPLQRAQTMDDLFSRGQSQREFRLFVRSVPATGQCISVPP